MTQNRRSKSLTLGVGHAARLCGEDASLDGALTPCSRCTCLYSVASSRGTHDGVSRFVWAIIFAPTILRACVPLPTSMRFGWSVHWAGPCSFTRSTPLRALPAFPASCRTLFSHGQGSIPLGSLACCTFYYTDEASRLLTDTTKKIDTQWFQVAVLMCTSVLGLPVRDCEESCNSSVPKCAKVSTTKVMRKTIFERLYLVQGLVTLDHRVKCPYVLTPLPLTDQLFLDFRAIFFNCTKIQK